MRNSMVLIKEKKAFNFLIDQINSTKKDIEELKKIEKRVSDTEKKINIITPDSQDVYNINKRIELLARRVAELESNNKTFWKNLGRG